jgi:hypothetical protein
VFTAHAVVLGETRIASIGRRENRGILTNHHERQVELLTTQLLDIIDFA